MRTIHDRTLHAMKRDRSLVMIEARMRPERAPERVATARRINRAIVHYLRNVYPRGMQS